MLKEPWQRLLLLMVLLLAINSIYFYLFPPTEAEPVAKVAYSQFKNDLRLDRIAEVTIQGSELSGTYLEPLELYAEEAGADKFEGTLAYSRFQTTLPPLDDPELIAMLEKHEVTVKVTPPENTTIWV